MVKEKMHLMPKIELCTKADLYQSTKKRLSATETNYKFERLLYLISQKSKSPQEEIVRNRNTTATRPPSTKSTQKNNSPISAGGLILVVFLFLFFAFVLENLDSNNSPQPRQSTYTQPSYRSLPPDTSIATENNHQSLTDTTFDSTDDLDTSRITYTIKRGDTLSGIAKDFGVDIKVLQYINNISDPSRIYEGQKLLIAGSDFILPDNVKQPVLDSNLYSPDSIFELSPELLYELAKSWPPSLEIPYELSPSSNDEYYSKVDKIIQESSFPNSANMGDTNAQQSFDYITVGSSQEEVKKILGTPQSINIYKSLNQEVWGYNLWDDITFTNDRVVKWNNRSGGLKVRIIPQDGVAHDSDSFIKIGSSKDDVVRVEGTPQSINIYKALNQEVWGYNLWDDITFTNDRVSKWNNRSGRLKVQ